jgi:hypothetical protein
MAAGTNAIAARRQRGTRSSAGVPPSRSLIQTTIRRKDSSVHRPRMGKTTTRRHPGGTHHRAAPHGAGADRPRVTNRLSAEVLPGIGVTRAAKVRTTIMTVSKTRQ